MVIGQDTYEIEILRSGTHTSSNGVTMHFGKEDLQEVVDNYDPTNFKAPLIISHETHGISDKELVNTEFAYGTPRALKIVGDRVKAVFDHIAPEFVEWVRQKKLLAISPSFYTRDSIANPTPGKLSLRHIASLGKSAPAIKGMAPLNLSEFKREMAGGIIPPATLSPMDEGVLCFSQTVQFNEESNTVEFADFTLRTQADLWRSLREWLIDQHDLETADRIVPSYALGTLTEERHFWGEEFRPKDASAIRPDAESWVMQQVDSLMMRVDQMERQINPPRLLTNYGEPEGMTTDKEKTDFSEAENRLKDLEKQLAARELLLKQQENELRKAQLTDFAESLVKEGRLLPAHKKDVVEFMASLEEKNAIDFSEGKASQLDYLKKFLKTLPKQVEFGEVASEKNSVTENPEAIARAAQKLISAEKEAGRVMSFSEAVDKVMKG